ncbi:MAG: response regulator [candidate division KSB1 bacterium]|nr:response regulator [candidate division KSB1 bacterium]MDZ7367260.1 response regulator [candidate division KSB1 bacterium]MDZ7405901.1 response regulator [candidate division KSB1 bacterium]
MARVLIVEDDGNLRLLYRIVLETEGYEVIDVGSGAEALRVLSEELVDVVVLELGLQDISGLQLIDVIRSQRWYVPIIVNSIYDFLSEERRNWDVDEIVSKSSGPAALIYALKRIAPVEHVIEQYEYDKRPAARHTHHFSAGVSRRQAGSEYKSTP